MNIDNAGDFHDGPVHRCMRRILYGYFSGAKLYPDAEYTGIDRVYATNQDDNFLIFD